MLTSHRRLPTLLALCCAASLHLVASAQERVPAAARPSASAVQPSARPLAPASTAAEEKTAQGEPAVRRTVIEDDGARIDELKVRGQTKRITVTPKTGGKPYEIIPPSGAPDQTEGPNGSNGSVGKRVWPVLSF
jgi:hypothetical protein